MICRSNQLGDGDSSLPPAGRTLARLSRVVDTAIAEGDLTQGQYRVLDFLADEPTAAAASRLAERLAVSRPTITAVVDSLAAKGLVQRRDDPGDRRRVGHVLTPAGRDALRDADRRVAARLSGLLDHLEPADRGRALVALGLWHEALDRARDALLATSPSQSAHR